MKTWTWVEKGKVFAQMQSEEGVIFQENVSTVIIYHLEIYYKHHIVYT